MFAAHFAAPQARRKRRITKISARKLSREQNKGGRRHDGVRAGPQLQRNGQMLSSRMSERRTTSDALPNQLSL